MGISLQESPKLSIAQQVQSLKEAIAPALIAITTLVIAKIAPQEPLQKSWSKTISFPNQQTHKSVLDANPILEKIIKLAALLDIADPSRASLASALKSSHTLKTLDEKSLLLSGEPVTCVSQIHATILDAKDAIILFAQNLPAEHLQAISKDAAKRLGNLSSNQDNTYLLTNIETKLKSAQSAHLAR